MLGRERERRSERREKGVEKKDGIRLYAHVLAEVAARERKYVSIYEVGETLRVQKRHSEATAFVASG